LPLDRFGFIINTKGTRNVQKLSNRTKSRISFLVLFIFFEAGIFAIKEISSGLSLDPFTWILLVFAAALGGAGVAYMFIGDWIRWPLTKEAPHSSNASMVEIEPKYEGWLKSPGVSLCCPICAVTWVSAGLLGLMAIDYYLGYYTIVALSVGGATLVVIRLAELLEWHSRAAQEKTAELNRRNAIEEAQKEAALMYAKGVSFQATGGKPVWVVKEEKVEDESGR
jgi:hypothetical protein